MLLHLDSFALLSSIALRWKRILTSEVLVGFNPSPEMVYMTLYGIVSNKYYHHQKFLIFNIASYLVKRSLLISRES